jgi:hypothetical protein
LIKSESTLHPANFKSPTVYYPPTTSKKEEEDSSEASDEQADVFQNPDTLEPTNISPGANIAQKLEQAIIFQDTAEPRDEDETGKSKEAYLPLNPSPTFALPSVRFVNMGSSSKGQEDEI